MKIVILFSSTLLCLVSGDTVNQPPRSVNLALETSFLFEPKHLNDNIAVIQNVKVFLDKLYTILAPHAEKMNKFRSEPKQPLATINGRLSFDDLLEEIGDNVLNLTNDKLKQAVSTLDAEIHKIAPKRKSPGIDGDVDMEKLKEVFKQEIENWVKADPEQLKINVERAMNEYKPAIKNYGRRMNDYYSDADIKKMFKMLRKINRHLDKEKDPSKVIRDFIDFSVVDKLKKLNETSKMNVINDMKLLADLIMGKNRTNQSKILRRNYPEKQTLPESEQVLSETNDSIENDEMFNQLQNTIREKLKQASEKVKKKDEEAELTNVIVDNVELFVEKT